jgi:hypothetical protein
MNAVAPGQDMELMKNLNEMDISQLEQILGMKDLN